MIWLVTAVAAGFFNAFWTALSKKILEHRSAREFTMVFRTLSCLLLLPCAVGQWTWSLTPKWWALTLLAGVLEGIRIWLLTLGVKKDYYSTYAFYNFAPFFTVLLTPILVPSEKWTPALLAGGAFITAGAFLFHRLGKWPWPGLVGALLSSLAAIVAKWALADSPPLFFAFWVLGIGALVLVPLERLDKGKIQPSLKWIWKDWKPILPVAFWSSVATILYYVALEHAPVSKVVPLVRANLLFGFLFSYHLLGEKEGWKGKALGGILVGAGLLLVTIA
jgi:drug/metabolite transporter (DMT)-like permease